MKKNYIKPNSLLIQMSTAPMMAAVSGSLSETEYNGEAGGKSNNLFDLSYEDDYDDESSLGSLPKVDLWED